MNNKVIVENIIRNKMKDMRQFTYFLEILTKILLLSFIVSHLLVEDLIAILITAHVLKLLVR